MLKYNFRQQVYQNPEATYACLNAEEPRIPAIIADQVLLICGDSAQVIWTLCSGPASSQTR